MLPNGSSNSTALGRTDLGSFLSLAGMCPDGYFPDSPTHFPVLRGSEDIEFIVGRPQDAPHYCAFGKIDAFVAHEDVVAEALASGISGVERVVSLPFAAVDVVFVVPKESPVANWDEFVASVGTPIKCLAEYPWLARRALMDSHAYEARFGTTEPVVIQPGTWAFEDTGLVQITRSLGSSEVMVRRGAYHCGVVCRSTGRTIRELGLKVIHRAGPFYPALFCRAGVRSNPDLSPRLEWFADGLRECLDRWDRLRKLQQMFPFMCDESACECSSQVP
jgi:ATP phosphoribosyltransferase